MVDNPGGDSTDVSLPDVRKVYLFTSTPTANDDGASGYRRGDRWHHYTGTTLNGSFVLMDATNGSAVWASLGSGGTGNGITAIADLATLKALTGVSNDATYLLKSNNTVYRYDAASTATANDNTVIIPSDKVDPPLSGRFLKTGDYTADEITETDRKFATQAQLDAIASNTSALANKANTSHTHVTDKATFLTGDGLTQASFTLPTGKYLIGDESTASGLAAVDPPNAISTRTQAAYTQPQVNQTVIINFISTANFVENQTYLVIETGGIYLVTAIAGANTATARYIGFGEVNPTVQVPTDRKVSLSGRPGNNGASSITTVLTEFVTPAVNSYVVIEVPSSVGLNLDSFVNIATAGNYKITSKDDTANPNTITAENLGGNNTPAGVTIAVGSQITTSGPPGNTGTISGASAVVYDSTIPDPSTAANEWKDYVNANNRRAFRLPGDGSINIYAFLSDILSTVLTGLSPPLSPTAILVTDTILEALGKAQRYFTDFLTNFNGPSQLIRLDSNGHIPKLNGNKITNDVFLPFLSRPLLTGLIGFTLILPRSQKLLGGLEFTT